MQQRNVYLKCDRNIEVQSEDVFLADLGTVSCSDEVLCAKLKAIKVHHFRKGEEKRFVISTLTLVEEMEKVCQDINVQVIGEPDVLVEWVEVAKHKGTVQWLKVLLVSLISFFGTAFTIMAYHNDIGIHSVFEEVYQIFMGNEPEGVTVLEISYSIGLAAGIIIFFNHIGKRKLTNDPTPIEVSIRQYEEDVDKALIAMAGREGKEK